VKIGAEINVSLQTSLNNGICRQSAVCEIAVAKRQAGYSGIDFSPGIYAGQVCIFQRVAIIENWKRLE